MKKTNCDKKAEIIAIGTELISVNGYNATGIDTILRKAGVPKGSFYHYFRSKEDFGLAVIDQFANQYDLKLASFFDDSSFPPLDRIRNYFEHSLTHLTDNQFTKGCLIGNLGQELADQNERFRARLEGIFQSWKLPLFRLPGRGAGAGGSGRESQSGYPGRFYSRRLGRGHPGGPK